jgi:FKBP-type peptidyl-prolyl cis-trans isomerase
MKKFFILAAFTALFAACNGGEKPVADAQKAEEAAKAQQQVAAAQAAAQAAHNAPQVAPEEQANLDKALIEKYVAEKGLKGKSTASGIYYVIETEGKGAAPTNTSKVKVHYRGTLLDGTEFDSSYSRNQPAEFPLQGVIQGWQEAIPLLKPGGKGKFVIPSGLAYGPRAAGAKIAPNSVLVFDVELLEVH